MGVLLFVPITPLQAAEEGESAQVDEEQETSRGAGILTLFCGIAVVGLVGAYYLGQQMMSTPPQEGAPQ
jgi:hypothetical protein